MLELNSLLVCSMLEKQENGFLLPLKVLLQTQQMESALQTLEVSLMTVEKVLGHLVESRTFGYLMLSSVFTTYQLWSTIY